MKCIRFLVILAIILVIKVKGQVLLYSTSQLRVSPLKIFGDVEFEQLVNDLGTPKVYMYKTNEFKTEFKDIFKGFHSAYNANGFLSTENASVITDDINDVLKIKETINNLKPQQNVLIALVAPKKRTKRDAGVLSTETPTNEPPKGPVLYKAKKTGENYYGLLYSSKPLVLKINNDSSIYYLGNAPPDLMTLDISTVGANTYTRLNVNVPMKDGVKVSLRFYFMWSGTYWSLLEVRFTDHINNLAYNLTLDQEFSAPAHLSYHCGGLSSFSDATNGVELNIFDMQVQIDAKEARFSDAYDCVPFITVPIWSGLFVTALLAIGLIIALIAIEDIKTMDRFDNYKTKQLSITISE